MSKVRSDVFYQSWPRGLLAAVALITVCAGCSCCSLPPSTNRNDEEQKISVATAEEKAVQVVKDWYRHNGYKVPRRIVVHGFRDGRYILTAGQEDIESSFEVDLSEMKVVRFNPGD